MVLQDTGWWKLQTKLGYLFFLPFHLMVAILFLRCRLTAVKYAQSTKGRPDPDDTKTKKWRNDSQTRRHKPIATPWRKQYDDTRDTATRRHGTDACLVARPHFSSRPKRFGSRGPCENVRAFPARSPRIRHRNELTEKDWENAVQGLGKNRRHEDNRQLLEEQFSKQRSVSKATKIWVSILSPIWRHSRNTVKLY